MMRRFFLLLVMLLVLTIPAWCQNPFNVTVTGSGGVAITTNMAAATVTVQQISGTQISYKVFDTCLSGGSTTVGAGSPYTFTGAVCGAGYATSTTVGTVQLTSTGSVTFQVTQQPKSAPAGATTCSGLSDSGTGCQANAGSGASNYAAGNDSRIVNAVPNSRNVAGHALSADVTISASDVGLGNVPNTDATNASNISGGTLGAPRLPTTTTNYQGAWNSGTTYNVSDVATYGGASYIAIAGSTGVTPGTDNTKWTVFAQAGQNGTNGTNGVNGTNGFSPNTVVSGCGVEWTGNYTFQVGVCSYFIQGTQFNAVQTGLTLSAADPSNDRIDAVVADNTGAVSAITGTPSATPVAPAIDPTTQIQLSFIYVTANTTAPSKVTTDNIYQNNTQWTSSKSGSPINLASTNNPYSTCGACTTDVEATAAVIGNWAEFTKPASGTVDLATRNALIFYIRSKAVWSSTRSITIQWFNGSTAKGNPVVLRDGAFGFSSAITGSYQQISVPTSLFQINGIPVTLVRLTVSGPSGAATIGFYLANFTLQGGVSGPVLPSNLMLFRGTYSTTTAYNANDVVVSSNVAYVCLVPNTNTAVSNTSFWQNLGPTSLSQIASGALANGSTATTQAADDNSTKVATTAYADTYRIRSFGTSFGDTGGSALTSGSVVYFTVPYACTITAWNISVDAGTVTFDIWKIATGTAVPTVTNTITASAKPALSTGTALHSTSMSGWTTSVAVNDIFGIQLNTVATAKYAEIDLQCNQ